MASTVDPTGWALRCARQALTVLAPAAREARFVVARDAGVVRAEVLGVFDRPEVGVLARLLLVGGVSSGRSDAASSAVAVARRLTGPRTGARGTYTQPIPGIGLPPMRRPLSNSHVNRPWNS